MQYKTQYGTIFAVKDHNGAPAIMCRAEHSETWSLSSMIEPYTPGAWTAEALQGQLDSWAATKGWKPVEESPACLCETCTCTGCHEDCYGHCHGCGHPVDHCNSYQTEGEKRLRQNKEDAPCNEEQPAPTGDAAATMDGSAAVSTAETTTTSVSGADANSSPGLPSAPADTSAQSPQAEDAAPATPTTAAAASGNGSLPAFDYSGLDADTAEHLQKLARRATQAKQRYILDMMEIVVEAHRVLVALCDKHNNQHSESTFRAWCASIGVSKDTAYRLLQVQALMDGSTPEEQAVLADAPAKLLYAAAKPSAPPELVQAVKDRDITTAKEFRELEAQLKAERAAREKAEQECEEAVTHIKIARELQIDTARERDDALRRATEAENFAADVQKLANRRHDENAELKAHIRELETRPVEVAVVQPGEAQIEAWRKEGEIRAAAALRDSIRKADQAKADAQRQVNALQDQLAAAVPDADACQRTADTLYETTENLRLLLRTQLRQPSWWPSTAACRAAATRTKPARTARRWRSSRTASTSAAPKRRPRPLWMRAATQARRGSRPRRTTATH